MQPKVYKFNKRLGVLKNTETNVSDTDTLEYYYVPDYFEFYTTGVEQEVLKEPERLVQTQQYDNERAEVLAYNMYANENLSDLILAVNNRVYLWDTPYDPDIHYYVSEGFMNYYIKEQNLDSAEEVMKSDFELNYKPLIQEKLDQRITINNEYIKKVILPKTPDVEWVLKKIKDYFKARKVDYDIDQEAQYWENIPDIIQMNMGG